MMQSVLNPVQNSHVSIMACSSSSVSHPIDRKGFFRAQFRAGLFVNDLKRKNMASQCDDQCDSVVQTMIPCWSRVFCFCWSVIQDTVLYYLFLWVTVDTSMSMWVIKQDMKVLSSQSCFVPRVHMIHIHIYIISSGMWFVRLLLYFTLF